MKHSVRRVCGGAADTHARIGAAGDACVPAAHTLQISGAGRKIVAAATALAEGLFTNEESLAPTGGLPRKMRPHFEWSPERVGAVSVA